MNYQKNPLLQETGAEFAIVMAIAAALGAYEGFGEVASNLREDRSLEGLKKIAKAYPDANVLHSKLKSNPKTEWLAIRLEKEVLAGGYDPTKKNDQLLYVRFLMNRIVRFPGILRLIATWLGGPFSYAYQLKMRNAESRLTADQYINHQVATY